LARVVVVSNRVAVPSSDGGARAGGLEVVLRSFLKRNQGVWFGWSGRTVAKGEEKVRTVEQAGVTYITTDLSRIDHQEYYNGFANRMLWPILHYRLDLAEFSSRDMAGYLRVNELFADRLVRTVVIGFGDVDHRADLLVAIRRTAGLALTNAQHADQIAQRAARRELDHVFRVEDHLHHENAVLAVLEDEPRFGRPESHQRHCPIPSLL